jgi:hypothetical protein
MRGNENAAAYERRLDHRPRMVLDGPDGAQDAACPAGMMSPEGIEPTFDRDIPMLGNIFDVAGSA